MSGSQNVKKAIGAFLSLLEESDARADSVLELSDRLDELSALGRRAPRPSDGDGNQPDHPDDDGATYRRARQLAQKRFPSLGFYNVPDAISVQLGEAKISMGDAFDDIADIAKDLNEVLWRFDNTSEADALWHFKFGYDTHWGHHLNNLRWYLHAKTWDV